MTIIELQVFQKNEFWILVCTICLWKSRRVSLTTRVQCWGSLASVSSFGVGGTNAHVVLKAAAQLLGRMDLKSWCCEHRGNIVKIEWNRLVWSCLCVEWLFLKPRNGHGSPEKVTWNRKPMEAAMDRCAFFPVTCLRGIAGFQVLLASWGKGHRQAVFTPVAQQVAVESRKTLEADPWVYLTVQIVHCKCFERLGHFEVWQHWHLSDM